MTLDVQNLTLSLAGTRIVNAVSFSLAQGGALALVGESGCGKSLTARALLGLLPPSARIEEGKILFEQRDLLTLPHQQLRSVRGRTIGMLFQDSTNSLNPTMRIGVQITEVLIHHGLATHTVARNHAKDLLHVLGFSCPERQFDYYPHQLSGGMRQRAALAIALAPSPSLLIADEPTTALDSCTQSKILDLVTELRHRNKMSVLLITHDLEVVSRVCETMIVMYAGTIVEQGTVEQILNKPAHPYTKMLLRSIPRSDAKQGDFLPIVTGAPPLFTSLPPGCPFSERCPHAMHICSTPPPLIKNSACWLTHAP